MITQVVAIKDRALDAYGNPFHVQTVGQAIRSFSDEINRRANDNNMHNHADDFDLYHLATYDNTTGEFTKIPGAPIQVAIGKNVKLPQP